MSHWATTYIGREWEFGARGPDTFDCYGFTCHVQRTHYGIEMLDYSVDDWRKCAEDLEGSEERARWVEVTTPQDGDVVVMSRRRLPMHIGVWIRANGSQGVLHCVEGSGVVFQLPQTMRHSGWGRIQYYRRAP